MIHIWQKTEQQCVEDYNTFPKDESTKNKKKKPLIMRVSCIYSFYHIHIVIVDVAEQDHTRLPLMQDMYRGDIRSCQAHSQDMCQFFAKEVTSSVCINDKYFTILDTCNGLRGCD